MNARNGKRIRLGVEAENMGAPALDPGIVAMAIAAEHAGADTIAVSDHLLAFANDQDEEEAALGTIWLEAFASLAAISSVTKRARLLTSVIILPQRNVLELLKTAFTVNFLSGGRLILGVGSGWNQREMAALGFDFASRGRRMDEMLAVIRGTWGDRAPVFAGDQVRVPEGVVLAPAPPADRPLPVYIGGAGTSAVSLRRALEFGDGWMPYSRAGEYDAAALANAHRLLREERARRDQPPLDTVYILHVSGHADPLLEPNLAELAALGFDEIVIQGLWDAGIEPGVAAIHRARAILDA